MQGVHSLSIVSLCLSPPPLSVYLSPPKSLELLSPRHRSLPLVGLGTSVGTIPDGIEAEVLVVKVILTLFYDKKMRVASCGVNVQPLLLLNLFRVSMICKPKRRQALQNGGQIITAGVEASLTR